MGLGYNYGAFRATDYHLDAFAGPKLGQKAPDATLTTPDGHVGRLLDFDGRFLVLELGSITCPLFQSRRKGMDRIRLDFPGVAHRILYTREAHPGAAITAHRSDVEKRGRAAVLRETGEAREVLVDTLEGDLHARLGGYPNAVFILNRSGCVVYRSAWNNPRATRTALVRLLAGKPAGGEGLFLPGRPAITRRTLRAAGKGSVSDFLSSLPRLIWKNLISRNLSLLFGRDPAVGPDAQC